MRKLSWVAIPLMTSFSALAQPTHLRLIETGPTQRAWLNESQTSELSEESHLVGKCGGFFDVTDHATETASFVMAPFGLQDRKPTQQSKVTALLQEVRSENIMNAVKQLSSYKNRYYQDQTGVDAAHWIRDQFKALAGNRTDISVELFAHKFAQPSVIARIPGTGPHANEKVIIGAHEDSISKNSSAGSMDAPGADDDASGVGTVLEIYRIIAQSGMRPERTLEFMTYAGEERGLLGSQDIAQKYKKENQKVFAVLHFDMTMFPGGMDETHRVITLITDNVNRPMTQFTEKLIDTYVKLPWKEDKCGYGCSDHASWTKAGFPSAFPFETAFKNYNPKIHSSGDTVQNKLDASFGTHYAKLGVAFLTELSFGE